MIIPNTLLNRRRQLHLATTSAWACTLTTLLAFAVTPARGQDAEPADVIALSDEFESREVLDGWNFAEGNEDAADSLDLGETRKGWLTLDASAQEARPVLYREVRGDFVVSARVSPGTRENDRAALSQPGYAGLVMQAPGEVVRGAQRSDAGLLAISLGAADSSGGNAFEMVVGEKGKERKHVVPTSSDTGEIQIARLGSTVVLLYRENGGEWKVQGRHSRPNLPDVLRVGVTAYSEGSDAAAAQVDWVRFRNPELPEGLKANAIASASDVPDEKLLEFLGKNAHRPVASDVRTWRWNVADPVPFRGVEHGEIWSPSMQRMVGYNIYLPPSYHKDTGRRYPVIYWLHGAWGDESMDAAVSHVLDDAIRAGIADEAIMVAPNAGQFSGYRDREEGNVKGETWIIKELIPGIDGRYRTISDGDARGIGGFSMGGAGSTRFVGKYPEMFCALVSFSAGVGRSNPSGDGIRRPTDGGDTFELYAKNAEIIKDRYDIYFAVGGTDRAYERHPDFLAHLHTLGIAFHFEVHPNVGHNLGTMKDLSGLDMVKTFDKAFKRGRAAGNAE